MPNLHEVPPDKLQPTDDTAATIVRRPTGATNRIQGFRQWPPVGQLAFALVAIFLGVVIIGAISNRARHPATSAIASRGPTPAETTTSSPPSAPSGLVPLTIAAQSRAHLYDREGDFGPFRDVEGCRNTRAELLIRTSAVPVTFTRSGCSVATGKWTDPWSGVTSTVARDFQIDHTVPLANAWRSGAWAWPAARRVDYANDLTDAFHLVPIVGAENEQKGDSGPDQWRPPRRSAWCTYARAWDRIKAKWDLTATAAEWSALTEMARTC
jgi:hypothetical protein